MKRIISVLISISIAFCHFVPFASAKEYTDVSGVGAAAEGYASREQAVSKFMDAVGIERFSTDASILDKYSDKEKISLVYRDKMSAAVYSGLISGYEDATLRPREVITRAEALVILGRALSRNELASTYDVSFDDVPKWAEKHINRLASAGIVKGYGDGTLGSSDLLTVEQITMLCERISRVTGPTGNYYEFVNSGWLDKTELPDGTAQISEISTLTNDVSTKLSNIIFSLYRRYYNDGEEFSDNSREKKIITVYSAAANQSYRDKTGFTSIEPMLEKINEAKCTDDIIEVMAELEVNGFTTLVKVSADRDLRNPNQYLPSFSSGYTGLDYALHKSENSEEYTDIYREYIESLFDIYGTDNPKESAERTVKICKTVADAISFSTVSSDLNNDITYCKKNNLNKLYGNSYMEKYRNLFGFPKSVEVIVYDKELARTVGTLLCDGNVEDIKAYLTASVLDSSAFYLTTDTFEAYRIYKNRLGDAEIAGIPTDYAAATVNELLGWELGAIYTDEYFSDSAKKQVEEMISDIKNEYEKLIKSCGRMSSSSVNKAVNKLKKMKVYCGYPENTEDYFADDITLRPIEDGGSLMEYRMAYAKKSAESSIALMGKNVKGNDAWYIYPQTVNAMYDPTSNSITVPAGIIAVPFFETSAEYEKNLGGIGMVIAHEISHAFDMTGCRFDEDGKLSEIWGERDKAAFAEICEEVEREYSGIKVGDSYIDGEKTANENIADISAMSCLISLSISKNLNLDKIFKSYAKTWRSKCTDEYGKYMLTTDVHSPNEVRVNRVLSNFKEFDALYGVIDGDGMYIPDERKIDVWR